MSRRWRSWLSWWLLAIASGVVTYKILTLDVKKVELVDVNTTVIDATKAKLKYPRE